MGGLPALGKLRQAEAKGEETELWDGRRRRRRRYCGLVRKGLEVWEPEAWRRRSQE